MNTFRTFSKVKSDKVSNNALALLFIFTVLAVGYLNEEYLTISWLKFGLYFVGGIGFFIISLLTLKTTFSTAKLNGNFDGTLVFYEDRIVIKQQSYPLGKIESINLSVSDYFGAHNNSDGDSLEPGKSNGTENWIELTLISKEKNKTYFQQVSNGDVAKNRKELISYHLAGKISFLRLVDIFGITKYEDIQTFKKTIY